MRIKISCDSCFHDFSVSDELVGRRVKCPSCGEAVRVTDDSTDDDDDRPRRSSKSAKSSKGSKGKKSKSGGNGLLIGLGIGGGAVILALVGVVIFLMLPGRQSAPANPVVASNTPAPVNPIAMPGIMPTSTTPAGATPPGAGATPLGTAPGVLPATIPGTIPAAPGTNAPPTAPPTVGALPTNPVPGNPPTSPVNPPASAPTTPAPTNPAPGAPVAGASSDKTPPKLSGVPEPSKDELKLPDLIKRVEPSVVRINVLSSEGPSTGSGFVVSNDGTVVTNYHVITEAKKAEVEFANGTTAKVLGYRYVQPKADIAIIMIDVPKDQLRPVPLSLELPLKGESVATFGAPIGLSFTTSKGAISAIRKEDDVNAEMGLDLIGTWLQTDAPISPGNSGGPLVDYYGKVVGMNTMQLAVGQNLNFAVSSLEINKALRDAPAAVKELKPEDLKPYQKNLSRKLATEEYDTDRGRRLFAEVEEIFLINGASIANFDPTDAIWSRVITRSQKAVEKSGIELSFGRPAPDAAVLIVMLEMKRSRKGTEGTQELVVKAELICFDPLAKKNVSPLAKVWKDERSVGTVSISAAAVGRVPPSVDENLAKFFSSFRTAYNKAVKANKEAKLAGKNGSSPKPDDKTSDGKSDDGK